MNPNRVGIIEMLDLMQLMIFVGDYVQDRAKRVNVVDIKERLRNGTRQITIKGLQNEVIGMQRRAYQCPVQGERQFIIAEAPKSFARSTVFEGDSTHDVEILENSMTASPMPAEKFWSIIERVVESHQDPNTQVQALRTALHELNLEDLISFEVAFRRGSLRSP